MSILLFVNLKGGVAKTTNAVAVAECLADSGYRTLLIDADHQCMSGRTAPGREPPAEVRAQQDHPPRPAGGDARRRVQARSNSPHYVVPKASRTSAAGWRTLGDPCSIRIDDFSTNMAKARRGLQVERRVPAIFRRRRGMLRKWLKANYDFTIVDCPPSIALQVKVFLSVADAFIVPAIPDRLSVRGSLYLLDRIRRIGVKIDGLGTLWSLYREQNAMHRKVDRGRGQGDRAVQAVPRPFETVIPNAAAIAEATEPDRKPKTFNAKYTPQFAKLYHSLCEEIVQRSQWQRAQSNGAAVVVEA